MSHYDFTLDMETGNSNSLILRNIKSNSRVLEVGAAFGRMTKYLHEQLKCEVYIVEKDKEAGKVAAQYAVDSYIGEEQGDVEKPWWSAGLQNVKFDYIIFADVLEHLHTPAKVLQEAKLLLNDIGSILISIPNIGYNAVLIDLLQNKFEYRDAGILDKTHIKFFTHDSLKSFVASAGLTVVKEMNALNAVSNSEFNNSYYQLPKAIGDYLIERPYGEVYQFIWELKRSDIELSICIPVYGKWHFTKSCLNDLRKLDASKIEIIVVDNASPDETAANLSDYEARMSNLKVIRNNVNTGFGFACNQAYNLARGKYVMFLNNDIRVKDKYENWTDILVQQCDNNSLVSPTGGKVDPQNDFKFMYETNDPTKEINYLSGWCIAAQKTVWNKLVEENGLGPFSKNYFCYFEDTHLGFLASKLNIHLKMVDIPVVHFGKITSKQLNTFELYNQSRSIFSKIWKQ